MRTIEEIVDEIEDIEIDDINVGRATAVAERLDEILEIHKAEARPKGNWEPFDFPWFKCSECGAVRNNQSFMEHFCPNCGADMKNERNLEYADNDTAYDGLQSAT